MCRHSHKRMKQNGIGYGELTIGLVHKFPENFAFQENKLSNEQKLHRNACEIMVSLLYLKCSSIAIADFD